MPTHPMSIVRPGIAGCLAVRGLIGLVVAVGSVAPQGVSPAFAERADRRVEYRDQKVQDAIRGGVEWLLDHQSDAGYWDADRFMANDPKGQESDGPGGKHYDIGITGLALLALLAQADQVHADPVRRAADWLLRNQARASGRFGGQTHDFIYDHAIATMAIAEASAMLGLKKYRSAATAGIRYLEAHRNPGAVWRYQPRDNDNDTSITSWCVGAYCAAHDAGIEVSPVTVGEALAWLEGVTKYATGAAGYAARGQASARKPGEHSTQFPVKLGAAMTAAALNTRAMASLVLSDRINTRAANRLLSRPPSSRPAAIDFYYWFHATEAMAAVPVRALQRKWFKLLHGVLLPRQRKDGGSRGSWDPAGAWGSDGGRVYSTAIVVLMLSSPYRRAHGDIDAMIPDAQPFRRVHYHWKKGEIGHAMAALEGIPEAGIEAEQLARKQRIHWYCRVHSAYCERMVSRIAKLYPDVEVQYERLGELVEIYAGHAVGNLAAKAVAAIAADPQFASELAAAKMLTAVLKRYDPKKPPRSRSKRKAIVRRLLKVIDKYPRSKAAEEANRLVVRLNG